MALRAVPMTRHETTERLKAATRPDVDAIRAELRRASTCTFSTESVGRGKARNEQTMSGCCRICGRELCLMPRSLTRGRRGRMRDGRELARVVAGAIDQRGFASPHERNAHQVEAGRGHDATVVTDHPLAI